MSDLVLETNFTMEYLKALKKRTSIVTGTTKDSYTATEALSVGTERETEPCVDQDIAKLNNLNGIDDVTVTIEEKMKMMEINWRH